MVVSAHLDVITIRTMDGTTWHYCESDGDLSRCGSCAQTVVRDVARLVQIPPAVCAPGPDTVPATDLKVAAGWCAPPPVKEDSTEAWLDVARRSVTRRQPIKSPGWLSPSYRLTDYSELDRVWINRHWKLATDNGV